ncbi:efflux RND transporter periplasmic adaptor subunit [Shewanella sp.]|uniref:efflux RND transporter periplasmic adaptor subunit n=1 Tax=Shewanella sp. TaxID=50422 RepID=UPI004053DF85
MRLIFFIIFNFIFQFSSFAEDNSIVLPSSVYSKTKLQLLSEQSGSLVYIMSAGQSFRKGDIIAQIDSEYENRQLAQLNDEYNIKKEKIAEFQRMFNVYKKLVVNKSVTEESIVQKNIELLNAGIELNQLKQEILKFEFILDKKTIKAPYDGVVLKKKVVLHEVVNLGDPLLTIYSPKQLFVQVRIPYSMYNMLDLDKASILKNNNLQLSFDYSIPELDVSSSTVETSYKVTGKGLLLGQSLEITIPKKLSTFK